LTRVPVASSDADVTRIRLIGTVGAVALLGAAALWAALPASAAGTFNVKTFGAKGNGTTIDSPAINAAITAANKAGGGTVVFPAGTYQSHSIHLKSNVTLQLNSGATIRAASSGMDAAEPNPFSQWQDFGHSHFHNALLWGDGVQNVGITGSGTIDGQGLVRGNSVPKGVGDKALSLKLCSNIKVSGVTFRRTGHFAVLFNGCHDLSFQNIKIFTTTQRDGINILNSWNVDIGGSDIESVDDAVVLKSDFALGKTFPSFNIHVHDSTILSTENNATQFGSETCGDFHDVTFDHLTITGAGKAGIGMVSMDGSHINHVTYSHITMSKTADPIYLKIGDRHSCPNHPAIGSISNVSISDVTGTNAVSPVSATTEFSPTIAGASPANRVTNVTLTNVHLTVKGGHPASDATIVPPENNTKHAPSIYGTRPAYGWWLRHVSGISFVNCSVDFERNDGRPAWITTDASNVTISGGTLERGTGSPYDIGFDHVTGYSVTGTTTTTGAAPRIHAVSSTPL
jgi:polygalacturonase